MVSNEIKIRNEFFISALFVESNITTYISEKLKINDAVNSTLLGNREESINFNQKIELLLESEDFSIIDKSKLSVYREIHKELTANKNASSFEACFSSEDHNDDFLLILYNQNDYLPREEKLINACYQLIGEVSQLVADFTNNPEVKIKRKKRNFTIDTFKLSKFAFLFSFLFIR